MHYPNTNIYTFALRQSRNYMNKRFVYITSTIIICLIIIFVWQLFWLKGLYQTIKTDTEQTVIESLSIANVEEIQYRMDSLEDNPKEGKTITITQTLGNEDKENIRKNKNLQKTKKVVKKNDTTTTVIKENRDDALSLMQLQKFIFTFTEAIHQAIDTVSPANLNIIDSIVSDNFKNKGINTQIYGIEVVDLENNNTKHKLVKDSTNLSKAESFDYKYDTENNMGYRIRIEPLTKTVLIQMSGILGTTLLIMIVLGFAFWYLIRTVLHQRTLEQMKDDFTNNMTHELKTPIAVAYSATDALLNFGQGDDKAKRKRYLEICKDQLSELSALVEQILSMSMERRKTFVLSKEDIQLHTLLQNLIEQHKIKAKKDVKFTLDVSPADLVIYADRTHINNIISNLIDNAIKYSKSDVEINIKAVAGHKSCMITVTDNGIGISADKQKYIFDKFYRVTSGNKYTVKGYGLGLFYVKTMIEKHNGTISVSSIPDQKTTFTIILPIH